MTGFNFIFMHGGGQGGWAWDETIAALALQTGGACRTLALDVPGCGTKRGRDTGAIGFDDIVAELIADVEAAHMNDAILVGHSQAGSVMPRLAEQRPDLFRRLIYASCSSPLPGQTVPEMIGKGLQGANPDEVGWYVDPATTSVEQRYRTIFCNDMAEEQTLRLLDAMSRDLWPMSSYAERNWRYGHLAAIPASYILFLRDRALPAAWQRHFAERFHADRVIDIDACHQGMMTRPHAFAEALLIEAAIGN